MEIATIMEGVSSDMSERIARDSSFLEEVFSWSINDIFNDNLYSEKVTKIPNSFETIPEYFNSYIYPLLEETRVDLRSSLEIISRAPYAEIVQFKRDQSLRFKKINDNNKSRHLYDIQVDEWRNRFNERGKEPYKTLPGDIFVLLKSRPETIHDLQGLAQAWLLASVTKISKDTSKDEVDDNNSSTFFKVKASQDIEKIDDSCSSLFLVFLMNSTTNKRIWNALHMSINTRIIQGFLQRNISDEGCQNPSVYADNDCLSEDFCMELFSSLNPSQKNAILSSLQAMQCENISQVQLVWGPPGTGKTKTLGTLLYFLRKNVRTLICAPTNIAITEVASRLLKLIMNSFSRDSVGTFGFMGDILLFGNKQRLRVGTEIEDIYLDYRVKRLAECFAPLTGWRKSFLSLTDFLEDCVSQYNVYQENELIKSREQDMDRINTTGHIEPFLAFFRIRFKAAAEPVRRCISIFCTHVSKSFIGEHNVTEMMFLINLLESFELLLFQDDLTSGELLELFSYGEVEDSVVHGAELNYIPLLEAKRTQCISVLKTLHRSLGALLPNIMNKESLTELCFQMASLIFCTASSSYKLYTTPMEPLSLLIIDEAAQLKECESAIPLQLPGLRHAILFGDECQLPAMVKSDISRDVGFGRSLFQRLSSLGWPKDLLNVQYRMHPAISSFPNAAFYLNQIEDAPNVRKKSYERRYLPGLMYGPYSFINIYEGREELDDDGRSRRNMVEAAVVAKILHNLYKTWWHTTQRHSTQRLSIGVISPYAAQVVAIEEMIGKRYETHDNFVVTVKSVDGFQGGEEDIIIFSCVRSNNAGEVGFLSSTERANVALTRARHCLWVLGNEKTLMRSDSIWNKLVCNARERNCFFNADEDKTLIEAIIDIKKELNQLDELLNKDSILFKSARWKVLFSDNFVKSFSKLPSTRAKKSVMNLLVKLSNGWRPKKVKADPACESTVQVVKQYKVEGRYVICTNDIMKESGYFQVLKIWDVVPLEDVSKLVKRLDNIYGALNDDFLSHCKERGLEGELEVPRMWSNSIDLVRYKSNYAASTSASDGDLDVTNYAENAKVSESLLLMKFYSLSAGLVGHLLSDSGGKALDLPFEVTDEESQIILHQKSSFILGRSGTGKTTVLTMKLYQKEKLHHLACEGVVDENGDANFENITPSDENQDSENVLRQLFVTVSPRLCYAIKQHVSHLKSFARNESSSMESGPADADFIDDSDQFCGVPDSFVGVPTDAYPLVLTFTKFLLMLDGTLGSSYFERFYDELGISGGGNTTTSATLIMRRKEVNYEKFISYYWPHFNSQLTKKLDSSRVFIEIISIIKGGLKAGETDDGKLSLEGYLHLSMGRTSTLSRQKREMIYDIFLTYEKMKSERGEYDLSDFVNDLHQRLKSERYGGDLIDFVYVDEVQDLTMRQISLFRYICSNVDEGFVFSGDTAQTIARGIDFRFQDVRCLFYNEFLLTEKNDMANGSQTRRQMSPIFHLRQNFRTHAGILKLGQSVIDLIYHFFPHSIDILPPENSLIFGEAPILLESGSDENAIVTIFGNAGNMGGGNLVGFGAEQVILVRDDFVRKEISSYVGKQALVLTIVECKGLEFQDVLLYNFFGSSPLKNQWRVIYEFMKMKNLLDSKVPPSFPNFNPAKHNVLCSELKQLYVAITRTRQRLWICENKEDLSKPMFDYWKQLCYVQVRKLDDSLARAMQVASSPEEWKARGKKLLAVENYEVATMCFERAGDKHWEIYAKAAGLKASADRTLLLNPEEASSILWQAAELFESINVYRKAADCFFELKEYYRAGKIYFELGGDSDLQRAGNCFTLAGQFERAAEVFAKSKLFSECLLSCTQGKLYDLGLQYIQYWKHQEMGGELDMVEQVFLENCALSLHEQNDKISMMKFVKAFSSEESMQTFLMNLGCFDELLDLEVELGNFLKAADIARERGDILLEADLLEKGGLFKEACELLLQYILAGCLWADGRGSPLKFFPEMPQLLCKAKGSAQNLQPHDLYRNFFTDSLLFFTQNYSLAELKRLLIISLSLAHKSLRGEIICTKRILDLMLQVDVSKYEPERDIIENLAMSDLERIVQSTITVDALIYFWNTWKTNVMKILKFLKDVEENNTSDFAELGEFCFNYLGIRKLSFSTNTVYICLYPHAEWMKDVDKSLFQKFGKLVRIDIEHLLAAANNYWSSELLSTGMKVLGVLELLRNNTRLNPLSYCSYARLVLDVYEIAQLLSSCKPIKKVSGFKVTAALQKYIDVSVSEYYKCVFPLDWRRSVSQDIIILRESEISREILKEVIVRNLERNDEVTYGQLGRVAMVLLGSPEGKLESSQMHLRRLDPDSPWRPFIQALSHHTEAQAQLVDPRACNLLRAVRDVYDANWRTKDYMPPFCFLYLVDRLMVSLLEFQGYLWTTRSSLVERFIHLDWKANLSTNLMPARDKSMFLQDAYCLLARMLHQLLMNTRETVEWVKKVGINAKDNFPMLLLRLVVLLCLVFLNSGNYVNEILDLLRRPDIIKQLPDEFSNSLLKWQKVGFDNAVVQALNAIDDPLVLVRAGKLPPKSPSCRNYIFLDFVDQSKEDLLKILFRNMVNGCEDRVKSSADLKSPGTLCSTSFLLKIGGSVEFQDWNVWEVFDCFLKLVESKNEKSRQIFVSNAPKVKVQIEKIYELMTTAMDMEKDNTACTDEDKMYLAEVDFLLLELLLLSAVLGTSGQQLKDSMLLIEDGARRLFSSKQVFEYFLSPLVPQKDTTISTENRDPNGTEKGNEDNAEVSDNVEIEEGLKKEDAAGAVTSGKQEGGQVGQRNQGKGNQKSKASRKNNKKKKR